jgi:uncharacterized protein YqjF (DUF2071 family)
MNLSEPAVQPASALSDAARERLLSRRGEPLFFADWERVLMIHFEVDPEALQWDVPFQLDLRDGRAFVSVVAFTMHGMRPRIGGRLAAWLFWPVATHDFLNARTYVRHGGETGIHFLAEWLSNRLAVKLGPRMFGLPYGFGRIAYEHHWQWGGVRGRVEDVRTATGFGYGADLEVGTPIRFAPCKNGSLDEWLMERYAAFNCALGRKRFFRVWHSPWPQCRAEATLSDVSLLQRSWPWFRDACLIGANFSPGLHEVWMGRPQCC